MFVSLKKLLKANELAQRPSCCVFSHNLSNVSRLVVMMLASVPSVTLAPSRLIHTSHIQKSKYVFETF